MRRLPHHMTNRSYQYSEGGLPAQSFAPPPLFHASQPHSTFPPPSFVDGSGSTQTATNLHFGAPYLAPYGMSRHVQQPWLPPVPAMTQHPPSQAAASTAHWYAHRNLASQEPMQMHGHTPPSFYGMQNGQVDTMSSEGMGRYNENSQFRQFQQYPYSAPPVQNDPNGSDGAPRPSMGRGRSHLRDRARRARTRGMPGVGREFKGRSEQSVPYSNDGPGRGRGSGRNKGRGGRGGIKGDNYARDMNLTQSVLDRLGAALPGSSPGEIERWIEARKRNWPSRTNVARKIAEKERRQKAGDLISNDRDNSSRRGRKERKGRVATKDCVKTGTNSLERTPAMFPQQVGVPAIPESKPPEADDALSRIVAAYESSVEEDGDSREQHTEGKVGCRDGAKRESGSLAKVNGGVRKKKRNLNRRSRKNKRKQMRSAGNETGPTRTGLLRKLLDDEVRREQSILLQAFRYLLETDYVSSNKEMGRNKVGKIESESNVVAVESNV